MLTIVSKQYTEFALLNIPLSCVSFKTLNFKVSLHNFPIKQLSISKSAPPNTDLYRVSFKAKRFKVLV